MPTYGSAAPILAAAALAAVLATAAPVASATPNVLPNSPLSTFAGHRSLIDRHFGASGLYDVKVTVRTRPEALSV